MVPAELGGSLFQASTADSQRGIFGRADDGQEGIGAVGKLRGPAAFPAERIFGVRS